jgi:ABC-type transport system involved in multi-copper enzyme maturation permease subunit
MIPALRSEFRKVVTVRSTYFILLGCVAIELLFAFYAGGIKASPSDLRNPLMLSQQITAAVNFLSIILALVGVLLVTHEYRYSTILYTFTAARRRSTVFFAKLFVIAVFVFIFVLFFGFLSPVLSTLGVQAGGHHMIHQIIPYKDLAWRMAYTGVGFSVYAFILAVIIRAQIGAAISIFLIPSTIEPLLGLILKSKQIYLPFSALNGVLIENKLSYGTAAYVSAIYMAVGLLVAWVLFTRRDTN